MTPKRPLIIGNWKMNGVATALDEARALAAALEEKPPAAQVVLCPPATLLERLGRLLVGTDIEIGGQDCAPAVSGAYTGDVAAEMLADAGAAFVIVGHSERRVDHGESSALVAAKASAALRAGLTPIICLGESLAHRRSGEAETVVANQLDQSLPDGFGAADVCIAYEPVWAIGSGLTPSLAEIGAIHRVIRGRLMEMNSSAGQAASILYGGSVQPANAGAILALDYVDGALVGGASLRAADFEAIIRAC
ncbi:MAG: triose-phosphate isomerase [Caulobacteraceae bacterium]